MSFNLLRRSNIICGQTSWQTMVQVVVCRLWGAKPLPNKCLTYFHLKPKDRITLKDPKVYFGPVVSSKNAERRTAGGTSVCLTPVTENVNLNAKLNIQRNHSRVDTIGGSIYYAILGLATRPMKRTTPDRLSLITKRKGWLAMNCGGIHASVICIPVAAAASVPSSLTSI